MKQKLNVLDCTIRDGGHLNNWNFKPEFFRSYLKAIIGQQVDIVEMGYRSTSGSVNNAGIYRYSDDKSIIEALDYLSLSKFPKIAVMVDIGKITPDDFDNKKNSPVDLIRVAYYKKDKLEGMKISESLKNKGYQVAINLMAIGEYTHKELIDHISELAQTNIDILYFADSFGTLHSNNVIQLTKLLLSSNKPVGFHSHDNIHCAVSNVQAAILAGATYVDGTIYGMGRGAGNIPTEVLLNILQDKDHKMLNLETLLPFIEIQQKMKAEFAGEINWGYSIENFMTGILGIHPNFARYLRETHPSMDLISRHEVFKQVPVGKHYSNEVLQKAIIKSKSLG